MQVGQESSCKDQAAVATTPEGVVDPIAALDQEFVLPSASSSTETDHAQQDTTVKRQSFRVGDLNLLCSQNTGREVVEPPAVSRIPYAATWLTGMANVRGALVPVVDLAAVFAIERSKSTKPYLLIFGQGDGVMGLLIDGLPLPRSFEAAERTNGLPPHPDILKGHVRGAYESEGKVWLDLDVDGFFEVLSESIAT